jgi:hypothetical protein
MLTLLTHLLCFFFFFFQSANIYLDVHYVHNIIGTVYTRWFEKIESCLHLTNSGNALRYRWFVFSSTQKIENSVVMNLWQLNKVNKYLHFFYKKYLKRHLLMYKRLLFDDGWISYLVKILLNCVKHERTSFPFCLFPRT